MIVTMYYGLSKPLPHDNSHVYRWSSHDDMKDWLNRYAAGKIIYEINTVFPADGNYLDAPLSFETRPEYVICEIAATTFCYFATEFQYLAENSSRVFLSVDAWGTYYGIGDSVAGKFGKTHLIQGHYNRGDLLRVPYIDAMQSNYYYFNPFEPTYDDEGVTNPKKKYIFSNFSSDATCIFVFASENRYYTFAILQNSDTSVTINYALSAYNKANDFTKFSYSDSSNSINLNSLISVYIFPYVVVPIALSGGSDGVLKTNSGVEQSAKLIDYNSVYNAFRDTSYLNVEGTSHFLQIGTKIFSLPQTGKPHRYNTTSVISDTGVKVYFTFDEQTEEITDEFSLPIYNDTAKNYWNQNASSVALQMTASAIGAVGSIAAGNVIGAVGSTLAIGQQTASIVSRLKQPCKISGSPSFYFTYNSPLKGGAEFALPSINQQSVISDINNRGYSIDIWRDNPDIDSQPNFREISTNGYESENYIYSQFVKVDFLTMQNSICPSSSIDRLRAAFFAGLVVHHEWISGIL